MRHVHGTAVRVIGEAFAALPTVEQIILSGYSLRPNRGTDHVEVAIRAMMSLYPPRWGSVLLLAFVLTACEHAPAVPTTVLPLPTPYHAVSAATSVGVYLEDQCETAYQDDQTVTFLEALKDLFAIPWNMTVGYLYMFILPVVAIADGSWDAKQARVKVSRYLDFATPASPERTVRIAGKTVDRGPTKEVLSACLLPHTAKPPQWPLTTLTCEPDSGSMSRSQAEAFAERVAREGWAVSRFQEVGNSGRWRVTLQHKEGAASMCVADGLDYQRKLAGLDPQR